MVDDVDTVDVVAAIDEALDAFGGLVGDEEVGARWAAPSALDGYSVGGLVTHVVQGISWAATVAAGEPAGADVRRVRRGGYFAVMKRGATAPADPRHDSIVAHAEDAAGHGWAATRERLDHVGRRLRAAMRSADLDRAVDLGPTLPFATTVRTFLETRVVELVVHGDDLAVSIGRDGCTPGPAAYAVCVDMLLATATTQHDRLTVLRALTRRERGTGDVFPVL